MRDLDLISGFIDLFSGRTDAFGTEAGGCERNPYGSDLASINAKVADHLTGHGPPIGIYPLVRGGSTYSAAFNPDHKPDWRVKFGVVDFDIQTPTHKTFDYETEEEANIAALNLQEVLEALDIASWIERTRSSGRHVWVFAAEWTPAAIMRNALLVACQVAGVSAREVNPKSDGSNLTEGQMGNYIRLPYPGALAAHGAVYDLDSTRTMIAASETSIGFHSIDHFVGAATNHRTPLGVLCKAAALYVPPEKLVVERLASDAPYEGDLVDRMLPYTLEQFEEDMPDDRSGALQRLAALCARQRRKPFEPAEILELLYAADDRWRKYADRSDRDLRLVEIVERAYA